MYVCMYACIHVRMCVLYVLYVLYVCMCVSACVGICARMYVCHHERTHVRRYLVGSFSKPTYLSDANANVTFVCTTSSLCALLHR